ncbi:hypothetical protein UFOVP28_55 [uncultured Caudovirales phage]|uniref:Uncharacterized protein n=1 Tax=uncultured Caudovirales phage TaxID=2100421 RepID=A0A6J5KPL3_9CAUD|nr:hypothetical protein UFOVP28_55 [uncultured Caudovirales phage]
MALAALAPLLGSLAGGGLASSGALGALGMGNLFAGAGGTLLGSALGSGLGTTIATGDPLKGIESGLLGYGLGGAMNAFGGAGGAANTVGQVTQGAGSAGSNALVQAGQEVAKNAVPTLDAAGNVIGQQIGTAAGAGMPYAALASSPMLANPALVGQIGAAAPAAYGGMAGGLAGMLPSATVAMPGLSITGEALQPAAPVTPTYTSPGLTPYKSRSAATIASSYRPGIDPEMLYFTPAGGFANGGAVAPLPNGHYDTPRGSMNFGDFFNSLSQGGNGFSMPGYNTSDGSTDRPGLHMQMPQAQTPVVAPGSPMQPQGNAMWNQISGGLPALPQGFQQGMSVQPYARGGHVSAGRNMIDSRGLGFLNHEAMKAGMPMGGPMAMPAGMNPPMGGQIGRFANGGAPMGPGLASIASPSMAVPDIAGDGSSDSIPATIDGQQPALLSSDEHVIPADAVAHIGNGSSSAGHKALKGMVNRVRLAKSGKTGLPKRLDPRAMMPA